jgi:hypothetical protein
MTATRKTAALSGIVIAVAGAVLDALELIYPRNTVIYQLAWAVVGLLFFYSSFRFVVGTAYFEASDTTREQGIWTRFLQVGIRMFCWFVAAGATGLVIGFVVRQLR